jgi:predicted transport protein
LYDELSTQLLSLDPIVTEVFNKLYIAYKAVTNFVDVIPLAKGLKLSINIPFHELSDPDGVAKDTTGLGKLGNGDAKIIITSTADIPYALGLIRQAYERQLDNSDE